MTWYGLSQIVMRTNIKQEPGMTSGVFRVAWPETQRRLTFGKPERRDCTSQVSHYWHGTGDETLCAFSSTCEYTLSDFR